MTAAADFPRIAALVQLWHNEIGDDARRALAEIDRLRTDNARLKAHAADLRDAIEYLEREAVKGL